MGVELFVVRHGTTTHNQEHIICGQMDPPLNPLGREQAEQLAWHLQEMLGPDHLDAIISSPLRRAMQTVVPLLRAQREAAGELKVSFAVDERFRERHFGIYEGLTRAQIQERYPDLYETNFLECIKHFDVRPPDGESLDDVRWNRVSPALAEIKVAYAGKRVAIMTHGFVSRVICRCAQPETQDAQLALLSMKNCGILHLELSNSHSCQTL